jgi:hypothetical protein
MIRHPAQDLARGMPPRKYRIAKQKNGDFLANPTAFANRCLQLHEIRTSHRRIAGDTANVRRKAVTKVRDQRCKGSITHHPATGSPSLHGIRTIRAAFARLRSTRV